MARTRLHRDGSLAEEDFSVGNISRHLEDPSTVWLDLYRPDRAEFTAVGEELGLHELVARWDRTPALAAHGVAFLLHGLLDHVVDGHFAAVRQLDERIEELDALLSAEGGRQIQAVQRQSYALRKRRSPRPRPHRRHRGRGPRMSLHILRSASAVPPSPEHDGRAILTLPIATARLCAARCGDWGMLTSAGCSATAPGRRRTADRDIRAVCRRFPALCARPRLSYAAGRLIGGSWVSALTVLLWAGLVRTALLHHVKRRVNSPCHVIGQRPFRTRRHHRATNPWPLSLLSFGESWPSLYRADPTCARHGVDRGRSGPPAAVIRLFERASTGSGTCAGLPRTVSPPAACEPERPHPLPEFP